MSAPAGLRGRRTSRHEETGYRHHSSDRPLRHDERSDPSPSGRSGVSSAGLGVEGERSGDPSGSEDGGVSSNSRGRTSSSTGSQGWRFKRPGEVKVPHFPTVTQVTEWSFAVAKSLVSASVWADKAEAKRFKKASQPGIQVEELHLIKRPALPHIWPVGVPSGSRWCCPPNTYGQAC